MSNTICSKNSVLYSQDPTREFLDNTREIDRQDRQDKDPTREIDRQGEDRNADVGDAIVEMEPRPQTPPTFDILQEQDIVVDLVNKYIQVHVFVRFIYPEVK